MVVGRVCFGRFRRGTIDRERANGVVVDVSAVVVVAVVVVVVDAANS